MKNNNISFYPVYLGTSQTNGDLEYLANETNGKSFIYFDPLGIRNIINDIHAQPDSTYVLTYTTLTDSSFGRRYIDLAVQVILFKKSGRDESGYFSPLEY